MDILIKSFNRPYYLERCIQSIYTNVLDHTFSITVLDDGTPEKYLQKLQLKFPEIKLVTSEFYKEKSERIAKEGASASIQIPIAMWLTAAKNATDYFVLLEDDIWFTQKINLQETERILKQEKASFLKLFWLNNPKLIHGTTLKVLENLQFYKPKVFTKNPLLYRLIFGITRYGNRKLMRFLSLYSKEKALHYYSMYGVAGAIFHKDYFLSLWDKHTNVVDENLQLKNAVKYWHKHPHIQFARTNQEYVATGFLSSATNKGFNPENFDVFQFNKSINEAWFNDKLDIMNNFPNDLNTAEIETILAKENNPHATVKDWKLWTTRFKKQFQNIGCNI